MSTNKCTNPDIGVMLTAFEHGLLDEADLKAFEAHLQDCDFCLNKLEERLPVNMALAYHRAELSDALKSEGLSFEKLKEQILEEGLSEKSNLVAKTLKWIKSTVEPWIRENPLSAFLTFEPLPYPELVLRGEVHTKGPASTAAIEAYQAGKYELAAKLFRTIAHGRVKDWEPWLFLGVSYFMVKRSGAAIKALVEADKLSAAAMKVEIHWYLAQSYILNSEKGKAIPLLQEIAAEINGIYSEPANKLLNVLNTSPNR